MKNLFLWYIPQAALFFGGYWFATTIEPPLGGPGIIAGSLLLPAAYTGGANLIMNLWARFRRRARGESHRADLSRVEQRKRPASGLLPRE